MMERLPGLQDNLPVLERFEARKKVSEALKEKGWLVKEEEYATRAGFSQRTNCVVEPKISTQWFVSMPSLAQKALDPVLEGKIKIHPEERFLATYKYWLSNIKDWCISRQLWWGQRIPAWYAPDGTFAVAEVTGRKPLKNYQPKEILPSMISNRMKMCSIPYGSLIVIGQWKYLKELPIREIKK